MDRCGMKEWMNGKNDGWIGTSINGWIEDERKEQQYINGWMVEKDRSKYLDCGKMGFIVLLLLVMCHKSGLKGLLRSYICKTYSIPANTKSIQLNSSFNNPLKRFCHKLLFVHFKRHHKFNKRDWITELINNTKYCIGISQRDYTFRGNK